MRGNLFTLPCFHRVVGSGEMAQDKRPCLPGHSDFPAFTLEDDVASRHVTWYDPVFRVQAASSDHFHESMRRSAALCRDILVAGILFLLAGVVGLSTATRMPCLQVCSGPWHVYKASHMTESEEQSSSVTERAESAEADVVEPEARPPRYIPHEETLPLALPLTVQKHHFRSPPFLP